jgi:2-keto-4-pentenoate hydratase/2-oxohepta-3-ene-1,7-dioic acid hydratase in catechol pathway
MKLVTYQPAGAAPQLGVVVDGKVINLAQASGGAIPNDMRAFIEMGEMGLALARQIVAQGPGADAVAESAVKILAPLYNPSKLIAIGLNYMDHVIESGMKVPQISVMFTKYPNSIVGPGEAVRWDPAVAAKVDYEAELALVIGKRAKHVREEDAYEYIFGYVNLNDVSARDLQLEKGDQWIMGKSLDTFCPLGPYIVTKDEIADPHDLSIKCIVNGVALQDSSTKHMIFKIPYLIAYLSRTLTLNPGDIITTGTPDGVGFARKPPVLLKHGDVMTVEIAGLGQLTNPCVEEAGA